MNYLSNIYGMVTKSDPITENGGLFFAHYLVLKSMLGTPVTPQDANIYYEKMMAAFVSSGLYLRSRNHQQRTVSKDEITGFMVASEVLKTYHKERIWRSICDHWLSYPATKKAKFYNPGSYYSWAVIADSLSAPIFAPLYTINLLISTNRRKEDTSSKLLYLTELYVMKNKSLYCKILWKYYIWRMKKMYEKYWVNALYAIYFKDEDMDHPLRALPREIVI